MSWELLFLLPLGALVYWWIDSMRAREIAVQAGKQICRERGLQFLDDTVVLARTSLKRNGDGVVTLGRVYRFEFSDTGDNRCDGDITLLGSRVQWVRVGNEMMDAQSNVLTFPRRSG